MFNNIHSKGLFVLFPSEIKTFLIVFVVVLSIGFFTGLLFINETTEATPSGIQANYMGNEDNEEATVMKFKKTEREMLTTVHTHILSLSFVFFLLGMLVWCCKLPKKLKLFLTVEPFVSVLLTFGGIYVMWTGVLWMKYVVILSGTLMTFSFLSGALIVLWQLYKF